MSEKLSKKTYAEGEPVQYSKPNARMRPPLVVHLGLEVHPKTASKFGEALMQQGENVWLNAHPKRESIKSLKKDLEEAKQYAKKLYAQRIEREEVSETELDALLDKITPTLYAEARALIEFLEDGGVVSKRAPVTVPAYSQGGVATVFAAVLRPDLFPNTAEKQSTLVLINSGGLTGKREGVVESKSIAASERVKEKRGVVKRTGQLMAGYLQALLGEGSSPNMFKALSDGLRHIVVGTFTGRILRESIELAETDLAPFLNFLTKSNGLRIAVMYDKTDSVFPPEIIRARRASGDFDDSIEFYETDNGGHFSPVHNSEQLATDLQTVLHGKKEVGEETAA